MIQMQWGSQGGGPEVLDTTIKKIVLYNRRILSNYTKKKIQLSSVSGLTVFVSV